MELRQIRYFVAIAEEEHFGRAAERIHVAQPALSRQMQLLEGELNVSLFDRLPRGIKLSMAGRIFLEHCRRILASLEEAVDETQAVARGQSGTLKLGFVEVAAWSGIIPETIMRFRRDHPGVRIVPRSMSSLEQLESLYDGAIDAGFIYNPPTDPLFTICPLERHRVLLAVPKDWPLARRDSIAVAELAAQPLISFQRRWSPVYHDELHRGLFQAGATVNIIYEAVNEAEMLALVTTGMGVALVNECQKWRQPRGVALLPVEGLEVGLELALVYRTNQSTPVLQQLLQLLGTRPDGAPAGPAP